MKIKIKKHKRTGEDLAEITEGGKLIATMIPRERSITFELSVLSKFIGGIIDDLDFPPKITILLKRNPLANINDVDARVGGPGDICKCGHARSMHESKHDDCTATDGVVACDCEGFSMDYEVLYKKLLAAVQHYFGLQATEN